MIRAGDTGASRHNQSFQAPGQTLRTVSRDTIVKLFPDARKKGTFYSSAECPRVGATGFEPAGDFTTSGILPCGCVIYEECRAARALHADCPGCLGLASLDTDLQRVIAAWGGLPVAIRAAITALIASQNCGLES